MKKNLLVISFVVICLMLGLANRDIFSPSKHLNIAIFEKINTIDPAIAFDDYSLTVTGQIYEPLFHYHYLKRPYKLIPLLARSLPKMLNNGKTMRITLKKGVRYHDHPAFGGKTRHVKSQDFVNQLKRLAFKELKSPSVDFFSGKLVGFDEFSQKIGNDWQKIFTTSMKGLEIIDDMTFDIHFHQKEVQSLHYLTMAFVVPVPEEIIRWSKNDLSSLAIGTGPFRLSSMSTNKVKLEANDFYRDARYPSSGDRIANTNNLLRDQSLKIPFLKSLDISIITDGKKSWNEFLSKKIDIMLVPENYKDKVISPNTQASEQIKNIDAQVKYSPSLSVRWLSFNMKHPVWGKNVALRRAIAHAINIDDYTRVVIDKSKLAANSIYNPGIIGYLPQKKRPYEYSVTKAKKLIKEAGFPNGEGLPELHFYTRSNKPHHITLANFIVSELAKIGIKVVSHVQTFQEYLQRSRSSNNPMDLWLDGWIYDYPDAENILQLLVSTSSQALNKTRFNNQEFDEVYHSYVSQTQNSRRLEYLRQAERIIDQELPWIMLSYENNSVMVQKHIRNLRWSSIIRDTFKYIDIE